MWVLERFGMDLAGGNIDVLAVMFDYVFHPVSRDEVHGFGDHRRQLGDVVAECPGLLLRATLAEADVQASAREYVEGGTPFCDLHGMVHLRWKADHPVADTDGGRRSGDVRKERLGCAHVRIERQGLVVDCPDDVETHPFGQKALFDDVFEDPMVSLATGDVGLGLIDERELHYTLPGDLRG